VIFPEEIHQAVIDHPYRLVFATVSGAHLYGFPSPDSDFDLRGIHVLPMANIVGFEVAEETIEFSRLTETIELDLVTHDVKKFFLMMLKNNGYVLEQLYSPLVVHTTPEHEELKEIGKHCLTRHHCYHYLGFSSSQWKLFCSRNPPRIKPLLYVYRVLLTGIHLMRAGVIEANLKVLNQDFKLSYIDELIDKKVNSTEKETLTDIDQTFHEKEFLRLRQLLEEEFEKSKLPETPTAKPALENLLKRLRLKETSIL